MSKLSDIMAAFLEDLTYAQDASNVYSTKLAAKYRDDKYLKYFPVPNGLLDEAVITLRFMADGTESGSTDTRSHRSREPSDSLVLRLSIAIARVVGEAIASHLEKGDGASEMASLALALRSAEGANKLARYFARDARDYLRGCAQAEEPEPSLAATLDALAKACVGALRSDVGVSKSVEDIGAVTAESFKGAHGALDSLLKQTGEHFRSLNDIRTSTEDLRVLIDNGRMAVFPDGAIQTITLKATLRDYKWVIKEEAGLADGENEALVAEA